MVGLVVFVFPKGNDPPPNVFTKSATKILNEMRREQNSKNGARLAGKFWKNWDRFLEDILVVLFFGGVFGASYNGQSEKI